MIRDDILDALVKAAQKDPDVVRQFFVSMVESGLHARDSKTGLTPSDEALNFVVGKVRQQGVFDEWLVSELSYNDKSYLAELQRHGFTLPTKRPNINRRHFQSYHAWGDDMRWSLFSGKVMLVGILICFASGLWFARSAGNDFSQTWNTWVLHAISALCLMIIYKLVTCLDTALFLREIADIRLRDLIHTVFKSKNFFVAIARLHTSD